MARPIRLFSLVVLARGTTRGIAPCLLALILLSISAATVATRASSTIEPGSGSTLTPSFTDPNEPYVGHWGRYTVHVGDSDLFVSELRIQDGRGTSALRINDFSFVTRLQAIQVGGVNVLHIHTIDNNEEKNQHDVFLESTNRGLRIDLILAGGAAAPISQCSHGRPLLLSPYSASLEWIDDFCHACTPRSLPVVLAWNGQRYVIATRQYPYFTKLAARSYQYQIIKGVHLGEPDTDYGLRSPVAGYYGNMVELGEGAFAARWIMQHVPLSTKSWFRKDRAEIRRKVLHSCVTATAPKSRVVHLAWLAAAGVRPADAPNHDCGCRIR